MVGEPASAAAIKALSCGSAYALHQPSEGQSAAGAEKLSIAA
jgi:hypothetical protein